MASELAHSCHVENSRAGCLRSLSAWRGAPAALTFRDTELALRDEVHEALRAGVDQLQLVLLVPLVILLFDPHAPRVQQHSVVCP